MGSSPTIAFKCVVAKEWVINITQSQQEVCQANTKTYGEDNGVVQRQGDYLTHFIRFGNEKFSSFYW